MNEVKRWNVTNENALWAADDGYYVLASDYNELAAELEKYKDRSDAQFNRNCELAEVLTSIMSKMHNATYGGPGPANRPITHYVGRISVDDYDKAIALLGGEKGGGDVMG